MRVRDEIVSTIRKFPGNIYAIIRRRAEDKAWKEYDKKYIRWIISLHCRNLILLIKNKK